MRPWLHLRPFEVSQKVAINFDQIRFLQGPALRATILRVPTIPTAKKSSVQQNYIWGGSESPEPQQTQY